VYARSVSAAGESDPIASDPGSCDAELRVVRRVVRVIDSVGHNGESLKADQPVIAGIHICT
jgi:hypothetical protein